MSETRNVPLLELLDQSLVDRIIDEAMEVLEKTGVLVENKEGIQLLKDAGMKIIRTTDKGPVFSIKRSLVEDSLKSTPSSIKLYDREGGEEPALCIGEGNDEVYFDPCSSALYIFDYKRKEVRVPKTKDFVDFVKLADALPYIDAQSTAMIPGDVPKEIADRYRLYVVLRNSSKPVVTGTFTLDGFNVMKSMLVAVRGSEKSLQEKPLAIFDVCPSPPLKWSNLTCHDLIECAKAGIPAEFISMPMTGASAPVTLAGALVQHTAETLSGIVIGQLARPGAPLIYGGSPTAFDMRKGTTPMGAIETLMIDVAYTQIGRRLGLPTQAYMGLSDAKLPDSQAGLESGIGAVLAALSGVDLVAGPGMLAFESCQSMEKLVIDNEIAGMVKRLVKGIVARTDPLAEDLLHGDIYQGDHFLTSPTTMKWFREEFFYPGSVIDRDDIDTWVQKGGSTAEERAHKEVEKILASHEPMPLPKTVESELAQIMEREAKKYGLKQLPS